MSNEILDMLKWLVKPGSVAELRIIDVKDGNYSATYFGYFDNLEKMAAAAARFDGQAPAVYLTLNECNPALLARAANRMVKAGKKSAATSDHDILKLRWLPIDADAKRPAGISSSDAEHEAALRRVAEIRSYLAQCGWPEPYMADSGNGGHLLYPISLDNTPASVELIKNTLLHLSQKFSDDLVEIDKTVHNPARIWKLYGTKACKGDATAERPHRKAELLDSPAYPQILSFDAIREVAAKAVLESKPTTRVPTTQPARSIDVEDFCRQHGLVIDHDASWKDGIKYQIRPCPFNSDHSEAVIIKHPSGAVQFTCLHNGCAGKKWQDLREKLEPAATRTPASQPVKTPTNQPATKQRPTINPRIDINSDLEAMFKEVEDQAEGKRVTISLPWKRLSRGSNALRPSSMTIIAGPLKTGKSFFTMNIIKHVSELGYSWAYLPLEDDRKAWSWRMLSILEQNYYINDAAQEYAELRKQALASRMEEITHYLSNVTENPRVGIKDQYGNTIIPEVTHDRVLGWIARAAKTARVIVVDPISQIEFNGKEHWKDESNFVRQALGIISDTDASLILVAHTVKRPGANAALELTAEDVQGSTMYTRLAHTTLLLGACEMKDSEVGRPQGGKEIVTHNRIVTIAAARNGSASHLRLAFLQDQNRPHFEELGFILPKSKRSK